MLLVWGQDSACAGPLKGLQDTCVDKRHTVRDLPPKVLTEASL